MLVRNVADEAFPAADARRTGKAVVFGPRAASRCGAHDENGLCPVEGGNRRSHTMPSILAHEHGRAAPGCVKGTNVESAFDKSLLVEQAVGRQEHLPVNVMNHRIAGAQGDVHRTVVQRIAPHFIEADHDIRPMRGPDRRPIGLIEVAGQRSRRNGVVSHSALEEVSCQRRLREHEQARPWGDGLQPREKLTQTGKIHGIVDLAGSHLGDGDIHDGGHVRRKVSLSHGTGTMKTMRLAILLTFVAAATDAMPAAAQDVTPAGSGEAWQIIQPPQSSLVFARDGSLIGEIGRQFRTSVTIASVPRFLPQAFIAVEDQRFYEHNGVDYTGMAGVLKDVVTAKRVRGGSTITQQLAGIMHPDIIDRRERSVSRTLRQQSAAKEMEKHYTKQQILEAYLNQVDLGHNWFGIESAARHSFGIWPAQLPLAQSASLAALPKSPPLYDPIRHPDQNRIRRNVILDLMAEQKLISVDAAAKAKLDPVVTAPNNGVSVPASYFVDAVRAEAERAGIPILNGGYRIWTTLEIPLQQAAVTALLAGATAVENRPDYKHLAKLATARPGETDYLQGAVIVIDPYNGDVRALVGGRNYQMAPFNRATIAFRQPGSSIKPIVFAKALEEGIPINRVFNDTLLEIPLENGQTYTPGDIDNKLLGPRTLRQALVKSRNLVALQLGLETGMDSVSALSQRLGITTRMVPVPSSAIGASVVHPIELTAPHTAFVTTGQVVAARTITRG